MPMPDFKDQRTIIRNSHNHSEPGQIMKDRIQSSNSFEHQRLNLCLRDVVLVYPSAIEATTQLVSGDAEMPTQANRTEGGTLIGTSQHRSRFNARLEAINHPGFDCFPPILGSQCCLRKGSEQDSLFGQDMFLLFTEYFLGDWICPEPPTA